MTDTNTNTETAQSLIQEINRRMVATGQPPLGVKLDQYKARDRSDFVGRAVALAD
jgi:hypothetical protein